mgnify:CR=1 FL=1
MDLIYKWIVYLTVNTVNKKLILEFIKQLVMIPIDIGNGVDMKPSLNTSKGKIKI